MEDFQRGCYDCFEIKIWTDAAKLTNMWVTWFGKSRYLVRKNLFIRNEAEITNRVYCVKWAEVNFSQLLFQFNSMRRNSVFEVLRVKRLADIQKDIACKGVCVNEKHSRDRERCPARPYSSSRRWYWWGSVASSRCSCCLCLPHVDTTAAATYCTPEAVSQIRPADGFLHNQCPYSRVLQKVFF